MILRAIFTGCIGIFVLGTPAIPQVPVGESGTRRVEPHVAVNPTNLLP